MSLVIIFALGYAIGAVSALLLIGLTLAGSKGERNTIEMVGRDAERYSL